MEKGLLIVISGPSGTGKGTVCKELLRNNNFWFSVSSTTRDPREGEIQGKSYYFMSKEEFEDKIKENDFLEYAKVYGNYYGTPKSKVIEMLDKGKDVILEIDIQGALQVKENYKEGIFIFILPPSMEELKNRIIKRGTETEESLMTRFKSAYKEINYVSKYNYAVVNDKVHDAVEKIQSIISAEKCRVDRIKDSILLSKEGIIHEQLYD
ncbi:guanylate kinase [Clostridium tetani]|uniref:Guanylate kinase n=1 Tax=Clostridium tetani (strain Massachusetts / E88) TaxID=212717 RepID=KGUA_CLOTE|nr:guanylate kinase [Clostridium tetani]Q895Q5.1 RecName: Full=Guanylate kinase; AltName: Full=GMP kinase [Clostridium tetani E88]AAO35785.1 guanylate kinase [Clostridium tetani E88]AVP53672.1 guanylate kinase [Clostridium tetani]KGI38319.1 guanylate kinase [Clostridium tetani]KGI40194.1 guanylate kinase [Clostridium tetani ATCC 9441]KGI41730.1 guanylate kinase [Clostridium tetani]